jgi:hypothetical protein
LGRALTDHEFYAMIFDVIVVPQFQGKDGISTPTTWDSAGSPYIATGNILVAQDATLTIAPGVIISACDSFADGIDDQIEGHESWYSAIVLQKNVASVKHFSALHQAQNGSSQVLYPLSGGRFILTAPAYIGFAIFDMRGKIMTRISSTHYQSGIHRIPIKHFNLAQGISIAQFVIDKGSKTIKNIDLPTH